MKQLKTNLKYLKENYPNLLSIVDESSELSTDADICTKSNEPNMTLVIDGKLNYLHSKYNASAEAEKWIFTINEELKSGHIFIFGIGLGYFLEALLNSPDVTDIYVCEPSSIVFNHMIRTRDISSFLSNPKIKLLAVGSEDLLLSQVAMELSSYITTESLASVCPPVYRRLFEDTYENMIDKIKSALIDQAANLQTLNTFQNLWLPSVLRNIPHTINYPSFQAFKGKWEGSTAIIVGSGPSLQADIDCIRQLNDKCLIIAAGSSIQALQHNGIHPHLIVSMDGGVANLHVFEKIDTSQTALLFLSQIHSDILELYQSPMTFSIFKNDLISAYLWKGHEIPQFLNTSTVTGTAIQAAIFMGASKIIMTGQDLSYPENRFYSSGVSHIPQEDQNKVIENAKLEVENVNGGQNPTTVKMMITLKDIELLLKIISLTSDVTFINSSSNGAKIEGTKFIKLSKLMHELTSLPSTDYDVKNYINPRQIQEKEELIEKIRKKLSYALRQCSMVKQKVHLLLDKLEQLEKCRLQGNTKQLNKTLLKIEGLWGEITKKEIFTIFFTFSKGHHINVYRRYIHIIVETENPIKKAGLISEHLGALVKTLNDFLPYLYELLQQTIDNLHIETAEAGGTINGRLVQE